MNKILFLLAFGLSIGVLAQPTDDQLASKNTERISELKSKLQQVTKSLEKQETKEPTLEELMVMLTNLDSKLSVVAARQDSLINALRKQSTMPNVALRADQYYLVIESQLSAERAQKALAKHQTWMENVVAKKDSRAKDWYYVIVNKGLTDGEVQSNLAEIRKKIPTAWYISGDSLQD